MSKDLFTNLQQDFLKNIMNNSKSEAASIIVENLLTEEYKESAKTVIENSLNNMYTEIDKTLPNNEFQQEQTIEQDQPIVDEQKDVSYAQYNEEVKVKLNDRKYVNTVYNGFNNSVVRVVFVKKDSSERIMWATKNRDLIEQLDGNYPESTKSPTEILESRNQQLERSMFKVFDLQKLAWRSVNLTTLTESSEQPSLAYFDMNKDIWRQLSDMENPESDTYDDSVEFLPLLNNYSDTILNSKLVSVGDSSGFDITYSNSDDIQNDLDMEKIYQRNEKQESLSKESVEQEKVETVVEHVDVNTMKVLISNNMESIRQRLREGVGYANITKKDSSAREMWFTLNHNIIDGMGATPKGDKTEQEVRESVRKDTERGQIRVFDLGVGQWRILSYSELRDTEIPFVTIPLENSIWAECFKSYKNIADFKDAYIETALTLDLSSVENTVNQEVKSLNRPITTDEVVKMLLEDIYTEDVLTRQEKIKNLFDEQPQLALNVLSNNIVRATFIKRNGDLRVMYCTTIPNILKAHGLEIKTDDSVQVERKMLEVMDIEKQEIRRLNLTSLTVRDNSEPLLAISLGDKLWVDLLEGNKTIESVQEDIKYDFDYFVESNEVISLPKVLTINNIIEHSKQHTMSNTNEINSDLTDSDIKLTLDALFKKEEIVVGYQKEMDYEHDIANSILNKEVKELFDNIELPFSSVDVNGIACYNTIPSFIFGVKPNGLFAIVKDYTQDGKPVIRLIDNTPNRKYTLDLKNKVVITGLITGLKTTDENKRNALLVLERMFEVNHKLKTQYKKYNRKLAQGYIKENISRFDRLNNLLDEKNNELTKAFPNIRVFMLPKGMVRINFSNGSSIDFGHRNLYVNDRKVFTSSYNSLTREYDDFYNFLKSNKNVATVLGESGYKDLLKSFQPVILDTINLRNNMENLLNREYI